MQPNCWRNQNAQALVLENPSKSASFASVQLLREQLTALDAERAQTGMDEVQYRQARAEIKRPALEEGQDVGSVPAPVRRSVLTAVRSDLKTTIYVQNASVEDTIDLILLQPARKARAQRQGIVPLQGRCRGDGSKRSPQSRMHWPARPEQLAHPSFPMYSACKPTPLARPGGALRWRPGSRRAPPPRADHAVPLGPAACR